MAFLVGLLVLGILVGAGAGLLTPLPNRPLGWSGARLPILGYLATGVAIIAGGALGLIGPSVLLTALGLGTGSYEDVLFIWPITMGAFPLALGLLSVRWFRGPRG